MGKDALAAVSACSAVIIFLTSIIIGLCMGSGVYFSDLYGGKDYDKLSCNSRILCFYLYTDHGNHGNNCILKSFDALVHYTLMGLARTYLLITISGMPLLRYITWQRWCCAWDSKTPLITLISASTINVALIFF